MQMTDKKEKIVFVATAESAVNAFLLSHLKILSKYFDITVIVNTEDVLFLKKQRVLVNVLSLKIPRNPHFFLDLYCLINLMIFFFKKRPNAVHSITPKAGLLAMLAAYLCFIPLRVHTFTGQVWVNKKGLKKWLLKMIDLLIGRLTIFNIVDSASQRDFLIQQKVLNVKKSILFGSGSVSGVDLKRFKPNKQMRIKVRLRLGIPNTAFIFIYLGRLNRDKGILDLAQAFAKIQNSKAFLLIVGKDEGGFVGKIKVINAHKSSQVRFVDFTNKPEDYLAASDVLCLPSYREGFGNVIIEAAAMGIPAIASDIYGISDAIINNRTGMLHKPKNVNSILDAMQRFLTKSELVKKYGIAASERVKVEFDSNMMNNYWRDFYLQAARSR
jgi:glycosyltransferase involved in cell wall biosynthesis